MKKKYKSQSSVADGARYVAGTEDADRYAETGSGGGEDDTVTSKRLLDRILDEPAGADPRINADALYRTYERRFTEQAQKAADNAFGLATRRTGGYGSSYAAGAAALAYDEYMRGLDDAVGQAQDRALQWEKYRSDRQYKALEAANAMEKNAYQRERDEKSDRKEAFSQATAAASLRATPTCARSSTTACSSATSTRTTTRRLPAR